MLSERPRGPRPRVGIHPLTAFQQVDNLGLIGPSPPKVDNLGQGFLTGGKFPPWGKYWEFRGEMRAFENWCLFKNW